MALPLRPSFRNGDIRLCPLRVAAITAMALAGMNVGQRVGLGVGFRGRWPILCALACAAVGALACAAADVMFLSQMSANYEGVLAAPLAIRTPAMMLRAFNENIIYRLFLSSILIWLIGRFWKTPSGAPAIGAYWVGFGLAQAANIWINVTSLAPLTPIALAHDGVRYFAPGMLWSWLYWRRGFQANEIASTSVHLFLQPILQVAL